MPAAPLLSGRVQGAEEFCLPEEEVVGSMEVEGFALLEAVREPMAIFPGVEVLLQVHVLELELDLLEVCLGVERVRVVGLQEAEVRAEHRVRQDR